ncbi:polyamine ABC transporter substrate-binding protein [Undibacterium parvum]|uniref:Putrescine-binding periplasmic protein n=2 Tax=Undibacterium TaxID=401469 RepID=A0A6M4A103_9BURK|nr:polyamine ABC transporter substrate-binding protein [Undibacterium parvum]AZP14066.1 polyamine ABC transporter substrate-binding protein [Undibacterium parvum]QJQ05012.1 polyamine ABC transporter substrate-binding protein [Undibacterium piscinae]
MSSICIKHKFKHKFIASILSCYAGLLAIDANAQTAIPSVSVTAKAEPQEEKILNFYNWSAYIADDTIANFEKETGIKVRYDTFDSSEILHAKLVAGRSGYDVVMSSSGWGRMQADGGLLHVLDKNQLPNMKNLDPVTQAQIAKLDPGHQYLVNYLWGYTTVGINVDKVKAALGNLPMPDNAWDLLFKPEYVSKLKSCGVSFLDSPSEVVPAALHYLGKSLASTNPSDYAEVGALLNSVRPYVTLFSSSGYINDMVGGSVCVAMGWSGDLSNAKRRAAALKPAVHIQPLMPKTGGVMFFDTMVIPVDAPHVSNAHKFMNYIMRPEVHASLTNKLFYANPNKEGRKFVNPEISSSAEVFPTDAEINRMGVQGKVNGEIRRLSSRIYTKFKTGY